MPPNPTNLHTFLVQSPLKDRSRILISLAPPPKHTSKLGRLFILAEYPPLPQLKNHLPLLVNQLLRHYEEESREENENAFERELEWANRLLAQTPIAEALGRSYMSKSLGRGPTGEAKVNFIFGCLNGNQLQFATAGQVSAYIIFKEKDADQYRHLDLIKNYDAKEKTENVFFTNLISGELRPDNLVIFCTAPVFDFLTPDRLKKIFLSRPTEEAGHYLETTLSQIENNLSFGGIIINLIKPGRIPTAAATTRLTPDNSIRRLVRQEQETENILAPSAWSTLKKMWTEQPKKADLAAMASADLETIKKITKIYNRLTGWQGKLKNLFHRSHSFSFSLPSGRQSLTAGANQLILGMAKIKYGLKEKLAGLPPLRRYLLLGALTLGLILFLSLTFSAWQKNNRLDNEKYNQFLNQIKEKLDNAESRLIYKNEDEARQLLTSAKTDLLSFPQNSNGRRQAFNQLQTQVESLAARLRHLEIVSPILIADLAPLNPGCAPTDLFKAADWFFFCRGNANLFRLKDKNLQPVSSPLLGELKEKVIKEDGAILLLNGKDRLTLFNPKDNSFASQEVVWAKEDAEIKFLGIYNNSLYAFDAKNNLITKHRPTSDGFAKGATWLKDNLKVDDAVAWSIDGVIYLGKANGEIWKLETGRQKNFSLAPLDPPLTAAARIFSRPESANLFILDHSQKRVIVWNKKDQKLVSQFTAPEFDDLRDFTVDEKNKIIYLLNGSKILNFKY